MQLLVGVFQQGRRQAAARSAPLQTEVGRTQVRRAEMEWAAFRTAVDWPPRGLVRQGALPDPARRHWSVRRARHERRPIWVLALSSRLSRCRALLEAVLVGRAAQVAALLLWAWWVRSWSLPVLQCRPYGRLRFAPRKWSVVPPDPARR